MSNKIEVSPLEKVNFSSQNDFEVQDGSILNLEDVKLHTLKQQISLLQADGPANEALHEQVLRVNSSRSEFKEE